MSFAMAATLVLGLLAATSPAAVSVKKTINCPDLCGGISIPYPFGIGPECSLPGFNLTCASDAQNTNLLLGNPSIEVWDFDMPPWVWPELWQYSSYPRTTIGYFAKVAPAQNYSVHWEAPGRPFAIPGSFNLSLFVVGCGFKVSFTGDSGVEVGNCSVACVGDQIMDGLPVGLCIGIGCCSIDITVPLRAFTLNISRTGQSTRPLEQVNAFITYNYNQYDGYRYGYQFQPSDLESDLVTDTGYQVNLIWAIPYQPNCKRAMENRTTYACVSNHSQCLEAPIAGYTCKCAEGYDGNPYVVNGCVLQVSIPSLPWDEGSCSLTTH